MMTISAYENRAPTEHEWRLIFPSLLASIRECEQLRAKNTELRMRCEAQEGKLEVAISALERIADTEISGSDMMIVADDVLAALKEPKP